MAPLPLATGATGVFRAAIGMAAAPQRGANPSFATEGFRAATGVAAAPQRGANPPFATGAGSGEAVFFDIAKLQKNVVHLGLFSNFFQKIFAQSLKSLKSLVIKQKSTPQKLTIYK